MGLTATASGRPVFLFGAGRCGSTFWQTLLCRTEGVWVWGEHAGILRDLLRTRKVLATSPFFPKPHVEPLGPAHVATPSAGDATHLAWNNGFRAPDLDDELRRMIDVLMRMRLPAGKWRWGFKEIRYGGVKDLRYGPATDETPRHLLDLFPRATAVLTLRHPRATIESHLRAFHAQALAGDPALDLVALQDAYDRRARAWRHTMDDLLDLSCDYGDRVAVVRIEDVPAGRATLATALDVRLPDDHPPVNVLPRLGTNESVVREAFASLWSSWEQRLDATMRRAGYPGP